MKIRQRIRAILAKAASTASEAEAETFLAKARELMEQHQLDAAALADADDPQGQSFSRQWSAGQSSEKARVHSALATYYGCKVIETFDYVTLKEVYGIVGPESARVTAEEMLDFVYAWIGREAKRLSVEMGHPIGKIRTRLINSFIMRCRQAAEAVENAPPATEAGRNALVVLNATEAKFKELYPRVKTYNSRSKLGGDTIRKAANSIPLHRQTTGGSTLRLVK